MKEEPVDFVSWGVAEGTFLGMAFEFFETDVEIEAKFAEVEHFDVVVAGRERGVVPGVALEFPDLDRGDGFEFGGFLVGSQTCFLNFSEFSNLKFSIIFRI